MLNQLTIVGRIVENPKVERVDNNRKVSNITVAVPRTYKNADGEYDTDFIDCVLWGPIAENTSEYCQKGDIVGIKGRLQVDNYKAEDGTNRKSTKIIAEKVSFLSSAKRLEEKEEKNKKQLKKSKDKGIA